MGLQPTASQGSLETLDLNVPFLFCMLVETHMSGTGATRFINKLNFDGQFIEGANEQSGCIWCLCDSDF